MNLEEQRDHALYLKGRHEEALLTYNRMKKEYDEANAKKESTEGSETEGDRESGSGVSQKSEG